MLFNGLSTERSKEENSCLIRLIELLAELLIRLNALEKPLVIREVIPLVADRNPVNNERKGLARVNV
ncbi:hypothetical protein, partial [Niallia circulans]|uniref:hypothetical protein n=1 Tax=Niallia circulans TaxID=1397 RepID=UPI0030EEDFC1